MKTSLRTAMALAATLTASLAFAQSTNVYKWTDASGIVHYTDQPPPGRGATRMTVKGGTEAVAPASASSAAVAADASKLGAAETAAKARNCETARANLATLSSGALLVDSTDPNESRRLRPDEVDAAKRSAQAEVTTYCPVGAK